MRQVEDYDPADIYRRQQTASNQIVYCLVYIVPHVALLWRCSISKLNLCSLVLIVDLHLISQRRCFPLANRNSHDYFGKKGGVRWCCWHPPQAYKRANSVGGTISLLWPTSVRRYAYGCVSNNRTMVTLFYVCYGLIYPGDVHQWGVRMCIKWWHHIP